MEDIDTACCATDQEMCDADSEARKKSSFSVIRSKLEPARLAEQAK